MSTRAMTWLAAVVICGGLAAYLISTGSETVPREPRAASGPSAPTRVDPPPPVPVLAPAPKPGSPGAVDDQAPTPVPDGKETPAPIPDPAQQHPTPPLSIDALLADVRRQVQPGFWDRTPGAALEVKNSILVARATPDVLDEVGARLDALRRREQAERKEALGDPAAAEELRAVMRGMLDRQVRLEGAARLLHDDPNAALQMLSDVEKEEPDNEGARALRLMAADPNGGRAGTVALPPRRGSLEEWILRWPSAATYTRLKELREKAGHAGAVRSGLGLSELLRRGGLTVKMESAPLWVVVRRLQVEALVEITLAPDVGAELELKTVSLDEVTRSLDVVLDALLAQLPAGHRWAAGERLIAIFWQADGSEPRLRFRYFDVRDLLGGPSAEREPAQPGTAPPTPPLYTEPSRK